MSQEQNTITRTMTAAVGTRRAGRTLCQGAAALVGPAYGTNQSLAGNVISLVAFFFITSKNQVRNHGGSCGGGGKASMASGPPQAAGHRLPYKT